MEQLSMNPKRPVYLLQSRQWHLSLVQLLTIFSNTIKEVSFFKQEWFPKFSALEIKGFQYQSSLVLVIFPLQHVVTQFMWLIYKTKRSEIISFAIPFLALYVSIPGNWKCFWCILTLLSFSNKVLKDRFCES